VKNFDSKPDYDFVIVGARCAGASTARLLARAGARVLVVDRGALGSDTLSTSYLMRSAAVQLQRWGILSQLIAAGTPPVRSTHFHYARHSLAVEIRPLHDVDALYAPRRTVLDPLLVAAASAAGAELRFGVRVEGLLHDADGRVCGVELARGHAQRESVSAHMVIGADGLHSFVARCVGAVEYRVGRYSAPTIYGYFEGMPLDAYHWYYAHGMAAGAAPTNDGLSTVFVAAPTERLPELHGDRATGMLRIAAELSPEFGAALADARRVSALRAFPGMPGYYRKPWGPGWALVGDAGYFRDPSTAHGISDALRDAELLAQALLQDSEPALAQYHTKRDAATERLFHASDELAGCRWDEQRVEELLLEASEGMRDGLRAVMALDARAADHAGVSINSALQSRSIGAPTSRLATRTDSRSGL
jgi:2-polyprenyl-6-methoxyphenol hydroxylase-like FAD-dependent oxidoreductase